MAGGWRGDHVLEKGGMALMREFDTSAGSGPSKWAGSEGGFTSRAHSFYSYSCTRSAVAPRFGKIAVFGDVKNSELESASSTSLSTG